MTEVKLQFLSHDSLAPCVYLIFFSLKFPFSLSNNQLLTVPKDYKFLSNVPITTVSPLYSPFKSLSRVLMKGWPIANIFWLVYIMHIYCTASYQMGTAVMLVTQRK